MSEVMTVSLDYELKDKLHRLAKATSRTESSLMQEALRKYLDLNDWHAGAIREGVRQADNGQLIPHEEVRKKWETKRANSLD